MASTLIEALAELGYTCTANLDYEHARITLCCRSEPSRQDLDEALEYVRRFKGVTLDDVEVRGDCEGLTISMLLSNAARVFESVAKQYLMSVLSHKVEYALLLTWRGKAALIEGFEKYVRLVGLQHYAAIAHSHPGMLCTPSPHDIEVAAELFANGSCCFTIVSNMCVFSFYRRGVYTLRDHEALLRLSRLRYRELNELLDNLSKLLSSSNVRFAIKSV